MENLERTFRTLTERIIARTLARLPVSPTALTVTGAVLNIGVAVLLALGYFPWAAALILIGAAFDAADGALARVTQRTSNIGAFLDSALDRYSEVLIGAGLLLHLLQRSAWLDILLLYLFMTGSLIFSYTRARAEAAGFANRGGVFIRSVRLLILAIGLFANQLHIALWLLAIGVHLGAFYRMAAVFAARQEKVS